MGSEEFAAIEKRFPRIWGLCVERGIITTGEPKQSTRPRELPAPEQVAATVDPNLAKTDFGAYLKALGEAAARHTKRRSDRQRRERKVNREERTEHTEHIDANATLRCVIGFPGGAGWRRDKVATRQRRGKKGIDEGCDARQG
jgi:hypothetical protein